MSTSPAITTDPLASPDIGVVPDPTATAELIARTSLICGRPQVITDPVILDVYRSDGSGRDAPAPLAVLLPATGAEVAGIVTACAELAIPFTVRGAGTSTHGGALARSGHALIALTRMRRIITAPVDANHELTVEPGVSIAMLRSITAATVLPGASANASVGGHVASVRRLRGLAGIDIVDPEGQLSRFSAHQAGYDIAGAFCGSRGEAGIAVALTLRPWEL